MAHQPVLLLQLPGFDKRGVEWVWLGEEEQSIRDPLVATLVGFLLNPNNVLIDLLARAIAVQLINLSETYTVSCSHLV